SIRTVAHYFPFLFFYLSYIYLPSLHSFPTRRSSDLPDHIFVVAQRLHFQDIVVGGDLFQLLIGTFLHHRTVQLSRLAGRGEQQRSEEHTSELQSRFDLVCRLLLEKKKINLIEYIPVDHRLRYDMCWSTCNFLKQELHYYKDVENNQKSRSQ